MTLTSNLKSILIRVDSSTTIGTGHVMRCLVLANKLRQNGCDVKFICRNHPGNLIKIIESQGFFVYSLKAMASVGISYETWIGSNWNSDAKETIKIAKLNNVKLLIVDHYGLDANWESKVSHFVDKLVVIDDLANRNHSCNILIDQNLWSDQYERYNKLIPAQCTTLLGLEYALLRDSFSYNRQRKIIKNQQVIAFFGGGDPTGESEKILKAMLSMRAPPFNLFIVHGSSVIQHNLKKAVEERTDITLTESLSNYDHVLSTSQYAFGASGSSNWERFCLGVPTSLVSVADNQVELAKHLGFLGLVRYLGDARNLTCDDYRQELQWISDNWNSGLAHNTLDIDGLGAQRVSDIILRELK